MKCEMFWTMLSETEISTAYPKESFHTSGGNLIQALSQDGIRCDVGEK
jgi:hypothetical protein